MKPAVAAPSDAYVVLVGERPGDLEDRSGRPFAGPAGRLLARALAEAGLDRGRCRVAGARERERLDAKLEPPETQVIVCLGAAARALLGAPGEAAGSRGELLPYGARMITTTAHPSAVLDQPDEASRRAAYAALVADLRRVEAVVNKPPA